MEFDLFSGINNFKYNVSKEKIGVVIQARMQSTRLPGKVLIPFYYNNTIIDIIIENVNNLGYDIVLAIPDNEENDILASRYESLKVFRGPEHNVLQRFILAAEMYGLDYIIRICADNPFIDASLINQLLDKFHVSMDYLSFRIKNVPSIKTHFGIFTEIVSLKCLKRVYELTNNTIYFEHVTNYIYTNEDIFNIKWVKADNFFEQNSNIRLTIDSIEDFKLCQEIYYENYPYRGYKDLMNYIHFRPHLQEKMKLQILKNSK